MSNQAEQDGQLTSSDSDSFIRGAIARLIRRRRKSYEPPLTQEELAYRAGISFEHLNHIENGKAVPSIEVLYKIGKALGFRRVSEFLHSDEEEVL